MRTPPRPLRLTALLLALLLPALAACAPVPQPVPEESALSSEPPPPPPAPEEEPLPTIYVPPEGQTAQDTVRAYFEQMYLSYIHLTDIDLTAILDTRYFSVYNSIQWAELLTKRRRLLLENGLCYVETDAFPYQIRFLRDNELEDGRLEYWDSPLLEETAEEQMLHFVITGEEGRAYPPWMAVNSQHTMFLHRENGRWKIRFHYYPGSVRKYPHSTLLRVPSDEEMLDDLLVEFAPADCGKPGEALAIPPGAALYDGERAADYARRYTESPNAAFYRIDDFMGNCANFTSQCVWSGFATGDHPPDIARGENMTRDWYAGEGGGSPAWENVEYFWRQITAGIEMGCRLPDGVGELRPGDVIQTSAPGLEPVETAEGDLPEERFNHSLVVVDADTLLLAQNSPGCFVYYADVVNVSTRILRPVYVAG